LADARRQEDREEEDGGEGEGTQSGIQRDVYLHCAVRAYPANEPHHLRHGLRQDGSQRGHRADYTRTKEWYYGDETLERNVRKESPGRHPVAHTQGLRLKSDT